MVQAQTRGRLAEAQLRRHRAPDARASLKRGIEGVDYDAARKEVAERIGEGDEPWIAGPAAAASRRARSARSRRRSTEATAAGPRAVRPRRHPARDRLRLRRERAARCSRRSALRPSSCASSSGGSRRRGGVLAAVHPHEQRRCSCGRLGEQRADPRVAADAPCRGRGRLGGDLGRVGGEARPSAAAASIVRRASLVGAACAGSRGRPRRPPPRAARLALASARARCARSARPATRAVSDGERRRRARSCARSPGRRRALRRAQRCGRSRRCRR